MKGETAVLTVPIDVATALEILRSDAAIVELHAEQDGIEIRLPFTLALPMGNEATGPPAPAPAADEDDQVVCDECGKPFKTHNGYLIHFARVHRSKLPSVALAATRDEAPAPPPEPERPHMADLGPIEARPFDAQRVREQAAEAI